MYTHSDAKIPTSLSCNKIINWLDGKMSKLEMYQNKFATFFKLKEYKILDILL